MSKVHVRNLSKVQRAVKGDNGKVYYIPANSAQSIPEGVSIVEGLSREVRIMVQQS